MAGLVTPAGAAKALPELRGDLALLPGSAAEDGAPTWLVHDVTRNRYFRLGLDAFRALGHWRGGLPATEFLQACAADGIAIDEGELDTLLQFLLVNQLIAVHGAAGIQSLLAQHRRSRQHWFTWLLHHYLFVRIPLWRPDAFLNRTWPWVSKVLRPGVLWSVRALGALGLLLAMQQWDLFVSTFLHFLSWQGLALYGATLAVVKSAHELGHAYVAKKHGCRVGSIGVAFLLLFPVFYTDTTDAWRLRNPRDRLRIVLAGVVTELHLAMLATLAWSLLPDGPLRSVAFFVGTTSWITSLLVNISPFMRFDGYFALSDLLRAENLQPRAFALARWHLRETLFDLREAPPETLPAGRKRLFIAYAYATWVYRLTLFLGIALLVYHFAFKLLGIGLFAVEIIWFIVLPMKNEVMQWWQRRAAMTWNRHTLATLAACAGLVLLLSMPWRATVSVPAVLMASEFQPVYAPEQGQLVDILVAPGDRVTALQPLVRLQQPELDHVLAQTRRERALVEQKIERLAGSLRTRQDHLVLAQQHNALISREQQLTLRQERLTVRAPIAGRVSQTEKLQSRQWVSEHAPLLTIRSEHGSRVQALVPAEDLHRLEAGASATWISNLPGSPRLALKLTRIDQTAIPYLPWPELASEFGGPVAVRRAEQDQLRPENAWYQLTLQADLDQAAPSQQQAGLVLIQGKPQSLLTRYWRHAASIWVRESGF